MKFYLYKGDRASNGARNLVEALGGVTLKAKGSAFRGRRGAALINWGSTSREAQRLWQIAGVKFNNPAACQRAIDKLEFFTCMAATHPDIMIPWAGNYDEAADLCRNGGRVYARTVLNGHSGKGIELMVGPEDRELGVIRKIRDNNLLPVTVLDHDAPSRALQACRLFTQGIVGKRTEFRVHIFNGRPILVQVKLRRDGHEANPRYNSIVRNVDSGWIYGVNNVPDLGRTEAEESAQRAIAAVGLDFGAVDIVYKHDTRVAYVLEVNTAPGLDDDGSALRAYVTAFQGVHE